MFKKLIRKTYARLSPHQKYTYLKYYKYFNDRWLVKNIFVFLIKPFFIKRKIKNINLFEQRIYSQNGEDGIIKSIFNKIGTTNKFCVEFGIHFVEGNTLYLKEKGWKCLWMDAEGDGEKIKKEFITAKNINELFHKYNVPKEFDLLSIDIDSNDYWVWKAIQDHSPRAIVIEYNGIIPPTESKTVKYDPYPILDGTDYFGASLLALTKLGKSKGYTLIACDKQGVNAFFVRDDLIKDNFEVKNIEKIYRRAKYGKIIDGKYLGHPKSDKSMIDV